MDSTILNGAKGAIVGWTLGSSRAGRPASAPVDSYDPVPLRMSPSPALDAWIVAAKAVQKGVAYPLLPIQYASCWRYHEGTAGFGLANVGRGVPPPLCGNLDNPARRKADALGRAAFWGLVAPDGATAVDAALWDSSYDHADEGSWCAAAVAWLVAQSKAGASLKDIVSSLGEFVPIGSDFARALPAVLRFFGETDGPLHTRNMVSELGLSEAGWSLVEVCSSLGQSLRFGSGLGHAVVGEGNRGEIGLVVGTIEAIRFDVSDKWLSPLSTPYVVGYGLAGLDAPTTLDDFAQMVVGAWLRLNPSPAEVETGSNSSKEPDMTDQEEKEVLEAVQAEENEGSPAIPTEDHEDALIVAPEPWPLTEPIPPSVLVPPSLRARLTEASQDCFAHLSDLDLVVRYVDRIKATPGKALSLELRVKSASNLEVETQAHLKGPDGWPVASRLTGFRAQPDRFTSFPTVLQVPDSWDRFPTALTVALNDTEVRVPIIPEDDWAICGPFANREGAGHDTVYTPEKGQEPGQVFNNRSGQIIKWESWNSTSFERIAAEQPGTLFLYTDLYLPRPCELNVVCGVKGSVKLFIDGHLVINCRDSRGVDIENPGNFSGSVRVGAKAKCLIKVSRDKTPLGDLALVFRDESGAVIFPTTRQELCRSI